MVPPIKCEVPDCPATFSTLREQVQHVHKAHRLLMILYPQGGVTSSNLIQKCPRCRLDYLKKDQTQHELRCYDRDEEGFVCSDEKCNKVFRTLQARNGHIRRVHEAPIPCTWSGCTSLIKPIFMNHHVKKSHLNQQVVCDTCGRKMTFSILEKHRKNCAKVEAMEVDEIGTIECLIGDCKARFCDFEKKCAHQFEDHYLLIPPEIEEICDSDLSLKQDVERILGTPVPGEGASLLYEDYKVIFKNVGDRNQLLHVATIRNSEDSTEELFTQISKSKFDLLRFFG